MKKIVIFFLLVFGLSLFAESGGLFVIDGEDAGSTPWEFTAIVTEGSNVFALDAGAANHGSYGYSMTFDGTNNKCYAYWTLAGGAETDFYMRFYFRVNASFDAGAGHDLTIVYLRDVGAGATAARLRIESQADDSLTWETFYYEDNAGTQTIAIEEAFTKNQWYRIEIHYKQGNGDGEAELWIDGVSKAQALSLTNTNYDVDGIRLGSDDSGVPTVNSEMHFDDCKGDTSPVGAYPGGSIVPIIMQTMDQFGGGALLFLAVLFLYSMGLTLITWGKI